MAIARLGASSWVTTAAIALRNNSSLIVSLCHAYEGCPDLATGERPLTKRMAYLDDNDCIRENYAELLRDEGCEFDAHATKQDAIAALQVSPRTTSLGLRPAPCSCTLQVTQRRCRRVERVPGIRQFDSSRAYQ